MPNLINFNRLSHDWGRTLRSEIQKLFDYSIKAPIECQYCTFSNKFIDMEGIRYCIFIGRNFDETSKCCISEEYFRKILWSLI